MTKEKLFDLVSNKTGSQRQVSSHSPVNLPSVEGFGLECDGGRVSAFSAADGNLPAQLHPGDCEDGASVGRRQREHILLIMLQEM